MRPEGAIPPAACADDKALEAFPGASTAEAAFAAALTRAFHGEEARNAA